MNLKALSALLTLAAIVSTSSAWAQEATAQPAPDNLDAPLERVVVKFAGREREVRGRLLRLDSETLSMQLDNRAIDVPLKDVLQVDLVKRDSLANGAVFGALYLAACARWWCGQGSSSSHPPEFGRDVLLAAGMGALVGAGIDALRNKRTTIYTAGGSTGLQPAGAGLSFRLRF